MTVYVIHLFYTIVNFKRPAPGASPNGEKWHILQYTDESVRMLEERSLHILEQLLLVLGLAMDGFAASVCMGMAAGRRIWPIVCLVSGFHVAMLLTGYGLGASLPDSLAAAYPWAAALLLAGMGANMIREAREPEREPCAGTRLLSMAALALATSLDAMTVGVAFALLEVSPWFAGGLMGAVMVTLSLVGSLFGSHVGRKRRRAARTAGGGILCLLGLKLLLNALGVVSF